jgi:hypothetical protein
VRGERKERERGQNRWREGEVRVSLRRGRESRVDGYRPLYIREKKRKRTRDKERTPSFFPSSKRPPYVEQIFISKGKSCFMVLFLVLGKFSEWPCPFSPPLK